MALPLLTRAAEDDGTFVHVTPTRRACRAYASAGARSVTAAVLRRPTACRIAQPAPGEQYRFHFDMDECIGCKCCVVACNEQNGNPGGHQLAPRRRDRRRLLSRRRTRLPLDGLQPLRGADLPERLPGRRLHEGRGDGHRPAQRRHLHRLPVLHLELLLRRAAVQRRARRRRQVRHVPRPAVARARRRRASAPVRKAPSRSRSSTSPSGAHGHGRGHGAAGLPADDGSLSTTRVTLPASLPPNARPRRPDAHRARAAALAAGRHDGADAAVRRRVRRHLAAAADWAVADPACALAASRRSGVAGLAPGGVDAASGPSDPRLPRDEDVAPVVAEPRGACSSALRQAAAACTPALLWFDWPGGAGSRCG